MNWQVGIHDSADWSHVQTQYQAAMLIAIENTRDTATNLYDFLGKAWAKEEDDRIQYLVDNDEAILDAIEEFRVAVRNELEVG